MKCIKDVAVRIELRIMCIPMLTHYHCTFIMSAHDERLGHSMGQIPCILSLCFKADNMATRLIQDLGSTTTYQ